MNFLAPLNELFGFFTKVFYDFFGSYGIAIVMLTIVIRGVLIPLNVRSQKSMMKQQALASQQAEIKRRFPDDKLKQQEELTKLFKENNASAFGGCLLPIVQLIVIWPMFYIVRAPLRFLTGLNAESLTNLGNFLLEKKAISEAAAKTITGNNIPILRAFQSAPQLLSEAVNEGLIKVGQIIDLKFLGMDLSMTPSWNPKDIFGPNMSQYLPLLLIPIMVLLTTLIQTRLTMILKPNYKEEKDAKERAKKNPARQDQVPANSMEGTMKMMNIIMPAFMLVTTFMWPAAMGFYWVVGNVMMILQQVIIYYLFTKPFSERKAYMAELKAVALAKGVNTADEMLQSHNQKALDKQAHSKKANKKTKPSSQS